MATNQLSPQQWTSLQPALMDNILWTPLDFLHHIRKFRESEQEEIVSSWVRPLDPQDDFRVVDLDNNNFIFAEKLTWDSDFFGYNIVRINSIVVPEDNDMAKVLCRWLEEARTRGAQYVFAVVFPEELRAVQALGKCGFELIETRLAYHAAVENVISSERFPVRLANVDDIPVLSRVACKMVNPFDRFHADPFISPADADRMMSEWIRASIEDGFADFVVVPDVATPQAFCTVKTHQHKWNSWGMNLAQSVVLGAVDPIFKGWYYKLISESNRLLKEQGARHVFWKTQSTNRAAIRTAEKLNYGLGRSEHIFRMLI